MAPRTIALVTLGLLASIGSAQSFGIKAGINTFSNDTMRGFLGDSRVKFGISPGGKEVRGMKLGTDLDFTFASRNGNRLTLIPLTFGATTALGNKAEGGIQPYAAARVGFAYCSYGITRGGIRESETRILPTANFELGFVVNQNLTLSARYDLYQRTRGFDFNGLGFQATWAFARF